MPDIKTWLPNFQVSAENDAGLKNYFVKTEVVDEIVNRDKWMVIGRKGMGKTAIYSHLQSGNPHAFNGYLPIALNFKNYPWPVHLLYKEAMEGELTAYQKSWRYLFYVQAVVGIIRYKKEILKESLSPALREAEQIISKIYDKPFPSIVDVIKSKIVSIKTLKLPHAGLPKANVDFSAGEVSFDQIGQDEVLKTKLKTNAYTLLSYFEDIFKNEPISFKIMIVMDQLDENWLADEIPKYSKILINLIQAAKDINFNQTYSKMKVVIFLRSDIYETLNFNDKTKIYEDSAVEIRWSEDTLNEMFFQRIKANCPNTVKLKADDSNGVFETQRVRHGASPFRHILRRSFYRPRDIVVYFNKIKEVHNAGKSDFYISKDLYGAEKNYSQTLYSELLDEWENQKPDIKHYLDTLQNIGQEMFNFRTYMDKYKQIKQNITKAEVQEILRFLFNISVLGQKVSARWEYTCTNPHIQIDYEKEFHVNNGLKGRLVLKENRSKRN